MGVKFSAWPCLNSGLPLVAAVAVGRCVIITYRLHFKRPAGCPVLLMYVSKLSKDAKFMILKAMTETTWLSLAKQHVGKINTKQREQDVVAGRLEVFLLLECHHSKPDEFVNVIRPGCFYLQLGEKRQGWAANAVQKMSRRPSYLNRSPHMNLHPPSLTHLHFLICFILAPWEI